MIGRIIGVALVLALCGCRVPRMRIDTIEAQRVMLVDRDGNPRGGMLVDEGRATILLSDRSGEPRVLISAIDDEYSGSFLLLCDDRGCERMAVGVDNDGGICFAAMIAEDGSVARLIARSEFVSSASMSDEERENAVAERDERADGWLLEAIRQAEPRPPVPDPAPGK